LDDRDNFDDKLALICAIIGITASIIFYASIAAIYGSLNLFAAQMMDSIPSLMIFLVIGGFGGLIGAYLGQQEKFQSRNIFISAAIGGIVLTLIPIFFLYLGFSISNCFRCCIPAALFPVFLIKFIKV
jgi:uncharacterized protein YacL